MKTFITCSALLLSSLASAFGLDDIVLWAGSGTNRAGLVIDFNDGTTVHSFAWGYRWNGAATGEDMLRAVEDLDSALSATIFGSAWGNYLDSLSYLGHSGGTWPQGYWSYWSGSGLSWNYASSGMSARSLTTGTWDGWSYVVNDGRSDTPPTVPVAAVPEPTTGLAWLAVLLLRRLR